MSKAILVMDMPSSCSECKLKSRLNCEIEGVTHCCNLAEVVITLNKGFDERLPNCPLREIPKKRTTIGKESDNDILCMNEGYNACIDEILGGSECFAPHDCALDEKSREEISKAIYDAIENNKPKIANVAVANFDGTIAYTLKKKVGGSFCRR